MNRLNCQTRDLRGHPVRARSRGGWGAGRALRTLLAVAVITLVFLPAAATEIRICMDDTDWVPFVYLEDNQATGIQVEIIRTALDELGYQYRFHAVPWKRCLKGLEKGRFDAVATASYRDERARYLWYPEDAAHAERSKWRVTQVEYVITLPAASEYVYDGDPASIPQPIRIPRGYSVGLDLRKLGVAVDDSALSDEQNIRRMLRDLSGSVITLPSVMRWFDQREELSGQLRYDPTPLRSKSYFFAISRSGTLDHDAARVIWDRIAAARNAMRDRLPPPLTGTPSPNATSQ